MQQNKYDIFISYRRADAGDKAEHLKDLLDNKFKGKISFDRENLTGLFDVALAHRIDTCRDFLLVIGKNSLNYEDKDFEPSQVELYRYLGTCSQSEFEQKIIELGPNAPIDFVRIEIARALNKKGLNIIPIVPETTEQFNFSKLKLPNDIVGIKRYEAIFYSDNPDALFKDVVPKLSPHLTSKPNKKLGKYIIPVICLLLFAVVGAFFWHQKQREDLRHQLEEKYSEFLLQLNTDLTVTQMQTIDDILEKMVPVGDKFWMSQFEFTQGWWHGIDNKTVDYEMKNIPKTDVSIGDITMQLFKLGDMTNISFELPSPEEWEYAARGAENHETSTYAGDNDVNKVAWFKDNSDGKLHASDGQQGKEPNKLDLYDMSGNAGEWCNSPFNGSGDGAPYTVCGGNYNSPASEVTVTSRIGMDTNAKDKAVGFRVIIKKR